jgi:toxin ParE1/3/4
MARFRLSRLAEVDITHIISISAERWGADAARRYTALLVAAMRKVATDPHAPTARERSELHRGVRSFHIRHARGDAPEAHVRRPAHVLYYRVDAPDLIEIVRVLHERMEPSPHMGASADEG